jgi:polyisoprenoid-binding protein YceI
MKSLIIPTVRMFELVKKRTFAILIATLFPIISPLAFAEGGSWSLDATASSARLFQGSVTNPESVNTGVARVTGKVKLDTNDLENSVFDLTIYPADEEWGHALSPEGTLPADYVPDATDHTLLTFHSKRILRMSNGELQVIGDLTLTRVERSVTHTKALAGPVYGDPVLHNETREVRLLFPSLTAAVSADSMKQKNLQEKGEVDLSGSARVGYEEFPALLKTIRATNWPAVIENEQCQMPSTVGEDYHGPTCTGTVIAVTHNDSCQMTSSPDAEDYSGPACTPAAGNETTIALHLKLLRTGSEAAVSTLSGNTTQ